MNVSTSQNVSAIVSERLRLSPPLGAETMRRFGWDGHRR